MVLAIEVVVAVRRRGSSSNSSGSGSGAGRNSSSTGTGSSGGNSTDGNNITSPRPFADDQDEVENYANKNVGYGAMGNHTSGMEKTQSIGNPNRTRFTKF